MDNLSRTTTVSPDSALPQYPTVTVAIPALNEEAHIGEVIERFSRSSYRAIQDILVVDGGSKDRTAEIVGEWHGRDPRVRLLQNPYRFQSYALNLALANCKTDVFLRADAHCIYADDYVENCVAEMKRTGAANVGGAQRFIAKSLVQAAVALAVRSPCGSGGAKYRDPSYDGFAETVFLGCYDRLAVVAVGGYAEQSIVNEDYELNRRLAYGPFSIENRTNQDAELNLALGSRQDKVVYVSSRIRVWYWPRATFRSLGRQYYNYGRGRALTSLRHRYIICRGATPLAVLLGVFAVESADLLFGFDGLPTLATVGFLGLVVACESIRVVLVSRPAFRRDIWKGDPTAAPNPLALVGAVGVSLMVMNLCHAMGYLYQLGRMLRMKRVGW